MTLTEVQGFITFAKAAYQASMQGTVMSWQGRTITLQAPRIYRDEIIVLKRMESQLKSTRKGHNVALADFRNSK